jgi:hypothetical protein
VNPPAAGHSKPIIPAVLAGSLTPVTNTSPAALSTGLSSMGLSFSGRLGAHSSICVRADGRKSTENPGPYHLASFSLTGGDGFSVAGSGSGSGNFPTSGGDAKHWRATMRKHILTTMIGLSLTFATSAVSADTISLIDTGAPLVGWDFVGNQPRLNAAQWLAAEFTVPQPVAITSIEGWMGCPWRVPCSAGDLTIRLYDDGGDVPGTSFFSQTAFVNPPDSSRQVDPPGLGPPVPAEGSWHGISDLNWLISPGIYWVAFEVPSDSPFFWVMGGAPHPLSIEAFKSARFDFGYVQQDRLNLGIRIGATTADAPIPEPATLVLVFTGVAGIGVRMLKQRRG